MVSSEWLFSLCYPIATLYEKYQLGELGGISTTRNKESQIRKKSEPGLLDHKKHNFKNARFIRPLNFCHPLLMFAVDDRANGRQSIILFLLWLQAGDAKGIENVAQYIIRNTFSLAKLSYIEKTGTVIYRSKMSYGGNKRNFQMFTPLEFIATITQHIPERLAQMVRYYGWYSNRMRGDRQRAELLQGESGKRQRRTAR